MNAGVRIKQIYTVTSNKHHKLMLQLQCISSSSIYRVLPCITFILQFVTVPLFPFKTKLQLKYMKNNKIFTSLKFQDFSLGIFVVIQQKVKNRKSPIAYW